MEKFKIDKETFIIEIDNVEPTSNPNFKMSYTVYYNPKAIRLVKLNAGDMYNLDFLISENPPIFRAYVINEEMANKIKDVIEASSMIAIVKWQNIIFISVFDKDESNPVSKALNAFIAEINKRNASYKEAEDFIKSMFKI